MAYTICWVRNPSQTVRAFALWPALQGQESFLAHLQYAGALLACSPVSSAVMHWSLDYAPP